MFGNCIFIGRFVGKEGKKGRILITYSITDEVRIDYLDSLGKHSDAVVKLYVFFLGFGFWVLDLGFWIFASLLLCFLLFAFCFWFISFSNAHPDSGSKHFFRIVGGLLGHFALQIPLFHLALDGWLCMIKKCHNRFNQISNTVNPAKLLPTTTIIIANKKNRQMDLIAGCTSSTMQSSFADIL